MFKFLSKSAPKEPSSVGQNRVYAVGDIHGRVDLLDQILIEIKADGAGTQLPKQIVFVGDYVDRGMESRAVIDRLLTGLPAGFTGVFLKGNHEDAMLRFLGGDLEVGFDWLGFGGRETLFSYGIQVGFAGGDMKGIEDVRKKFSSTLPPAHMDFFMKLQLMHRAGDYCFVHAGVRPGVPLGKQSANDLMWIRNEFLFSMAEFGGVIVHGHTISPEPEVKENRIGIDTGAYATSRLTCLVLEGAERRFLTT
ncbi:MAG: serine/threonine protein phosphatase [Alphaproteobacteria bacterium]|nr:serine/threonine protein phosphatase [Alphaproteobacteria bacterium]